MTFLLICAGPAGARTSAGDKWMGEGRVAEQKKEWDAALTSYEKALAADPGEVVYRMAADRARFEAAQAHVERGIEIRTQGLLEGALLHFEMAARINPASAAARQEIERTREMLEREQAAIKATGKASSPEDRGMTPVEQMRKQTREDFERMLPAPKLQPLSPVPINLKMVNQPPRILFETVGKYAGINVLFDPEYQPGKNTSVELMDSTIAEALDCLAMVTKSFWRTLSRNTIFVTNDTATKRHDYEQQVTKVFYLSNVNSAQELQEVIMTVRTVAELQKVTQYNAQYAIIVRGEADRVALAEKLIADLDKPRSEVVVDLLVIEAGTVFSKQITAAIAPTGLNLPVSFSPRSSLQVGTTTSSSSSSDSSSSSTSSTTSSTSSSSSSTTSSIPLSALKHLSSADFSVTLPSGLLQAALSDANTRILQAPQIRTVDNMKASIKIGDREPTATGSYQPAVSGTSVNALVNTQFTYIDVGVNVDLVARVHDNGDVSLHIELEISNVDGYVPLGGIDEPIIGQRKVVHDVRMREGEVNLMGGLTNQQDSKTVTGIPGLSSIPVLRRLFSGESVTHNRTDLMIALIPHIVRRPEVTPENIREISVGGGNSVKLTYRPDAGQKSETKPAEPAAKPR